MEVFVVAVVVEHAAQGCTILGRRGFREEKNRGCVRRKKGDIIHIGWAVFVRFFVFWVMGVN
jgi:hypothetical protein